VNGVIVVAPVEAQWAPRAECDLSEAHLLVARLYEPKLLALLVHSGGVRAIVIDARIATATLRTLRGCVLPSSTIKVLLVHEGTNAIEEGPHRSSSWPAERGAIRTLLGLP